MNTYFGFFGIIFFALGFLLHSKEKKRHFNRRNSAGIERFNSYEDASWQRFLDFLIRKSGNLLILLGIGFFLYFCSIT